MASKRKHRDYERTCDCSAYPFPHRLLGGKCKGRKVIAQTFDSGKECRACVLSDCGSCQVLEGLENTKNAPCLQEFIAFEGIRPPSNWRQSITYFKAQP